MRIVDSLNIGPRQRVVLLEVEDTWVLVGVTAGQMNVLHTLPAGALASPQQPGAIAHSLPAVLAASFGTSLSKLGRKTGGHQQESNPIGDSETAQPGRGGDNSFAHKLGQALRRG
jgi:flagellar protein FliO/FliZ